MDITDANSVHIRDAYNAGMETMNNYLSTGGLRSSATNLTVSFCPDGSDQFFFYNDSNKKIVDFWDDRGDSKAITFRNDGDDQTMVFNRYVRVVWRGANPPDTNTAIHVIDNDGGTYIMRDRLSVKQWNSRSDDDRCCYQLFITRK